MTRSATMFQLPTSEALKLCEQPGLSLQPLYTSTKIPINSRAPFVRDRQYKCEIAVRSQARIGILNIVLIVSGIALSVYATAIGLWSAIVSVLKAFSI